MSARQCGLQDARRGYGCTPRKVVGYEDVDEYEMTNEEIRAYLTAYEKAEILDAGLNLVNRSSYSNKDHHQMFFVEDAW